MDLPISLRKDGTEARYNAVGKAVLHDLEPIQEFDHWVVVKNEYPYDMFFQTHDMLVPRRAVANRHELNPDERFELEQILKNWVELHYDVILDNTYKSRSIKDHYHLHLLTYYSKREEAVA